MAIGLGVLGLTPLVFWAMTPKELNAALSGKFGTGANLQALTRGDLTDLMRQFPDSEKIEEGGV
jgi:uncharacterized phage protein (TIGR02216 family)